MTYETTSEDAAPGLVSLRRSPALYSLFADYGVGLDAMEYFCVFHHERDNSFIGIPVFTDRNSSQHIRVTFARTFDSYHHASPSSRRRHLFNLHRHIGKTSLILSSSAILTMRLHLLNVSAVSFTDRTLTDDQVAQLAESGVRSITLVLDRSGFSFREQRRVLELLALQRFIRTLSVTIIDRSQALTDSELLERLV